MGTAGHRSPGSGRAAGGGYGLWGSDLTCTEYQVSICAKDSSGPYDYAMVSRLVALAKATGLDYAVDVYPHYSSDIVSCHMAGGERRPGGPHRPRRSRLSRHGADALGRNGNTIALAAARIWSASNRRGMARRKGVQAVCPSGQSLPSADSFGPAGLDSGAPVGGGASRGDDDLGRSTIALAAAIWSASNKRRNGRGGDSRNTAPFACKELKVI